MKSKIIALVLALLVFPVVNTHASNCPLPTTLRELVKQSEQIVVARILSIEEEKENLWANHTTQMEVVEIINGHLDVTNFSIGISGSVTSRLSDSETYGQLAMVFLKPAWKGDGFHAYPYSEGFKLLDEEGMTTYRQRVKEMQAILQLQDEKRRNELTVDWLIKCVKNPVTRWEGVQDLSPYSSFMSSYDPDKQEMVRNIELTTAQKKELRTMVFSIDQIQHDDTGIIDLVTMEKDPEMLNFLVVHLKKAVKEKYWAQNYLMYRIGKLSGRSDLQGIFEEIQQLDYNDERDEKYEKLAQEFVHTL